MADDKGLIDQWLPEGSFKKWLLDTAPGKLLIVGLIGVFVFIAVNAVLDEAPNVPMWLWMLIIVCLLARKKA
jgi:hypothetical protein